MRRHRTVYIFNMGMRWIDIRYLCLVFWREFKSFPYNCFSMSCRSYVFRNAKHEQSFNFIHKVVKSIMGKIFNSLKWIVIEARCCYILCSWPSHWLAQFTPVNNKGSTYFILQFKFIEINSRSRKKNGHHLFLLPCDNLT